MPGLWSTNVWEIFDQHFDCISLIFLHKASGLHTVSFFALNSTRVFNESASHACCLARHTYASCAKGCSSHEMEIGLVLVSPRYLNERHFESFGFRRIRCSEFAAHRCCWINSFFLRFFLFFWLLYGFSHLFLLLYSPCGFTRISTLCVSKSSSRRARGNNLDVARPITLVSWPSAPSRAHSESIWENRRLRERQIKRERVERERERRQKTKERSVRWPFRLPVLFPFFSPIVLLFITYYSLTHPLISYEQPNWNS